jgi:hypothetical protein
MNNDELITTLRQQRGLVAMTTPVEQIISRGRTVRTRRRVRMAAGALGSAGAAAAIAVGVVLPATSTTASQLPGHLPGYRQPSLPTVSQPSIRLAAWTVTRLADGTIKVTFRQATDPAGLQRTLRADGVPASVTFTGHQNPACQPYAGGKGFAPFGSAPGPVGWSGSPSDPKAAFNSPDAMVIHPSALPAGVGLQIWTSGTPGGADNFQLNFGLVHASPQCTGS